MVIVEPTNPALKIFKVVALPEFPERDAVYFVADSESSDHVDIYVTGSDAGPSIRRTLSRGEMLQLIENGSAATISADPGNSITLGADGKLFSQMQWAGTPNW